MNTACETCGAPARVFVSNQLPGRGKVVRAFCIACADHAEQTCDLVQPAAPPPLSLAAVYIATGAFVAALCAAADWVRLGEQPGFGFYQLAALLVSVVLFLSGLVMRTPSVAFVAFLMAGLSAFADWIQIGLVEGFGWWQRIGTAVGIILILRGLWLARPPKRRTSGAS